MTFRFIGIAAALLATVALAPVHRGLPMASATEVALRTAVTSVASLAPGCDAGCVPCSHWLFGDGIEMPPCPSCGYDESIAFSGCSAPNSWPHTCPAQNSQCEGGGGTAPGGGQEPEPSEHVSSPEVLLALWAAAADNDHETLAELTQLAGVSLNHDRRAVQAVSCTGNVVAHVPLTEQQYSHLVAAASAHAD
jgi:hypothetical protein